MKTNLKQLMMVAVAAATLVGGPAWGLSRVFDFEGVEYGTPDGTCPGPLPPMFNRAEYGLQSAGFVQDPAACGEGTVPGGFGSDSALTAQVNSTRSEVIRFSWADPTNDESYARIIAESSGAAIPISKNPVVYLGVGGKISMKVAIYAFDASEAPNTAGQLEFSLLVRETGSNLPLGEDGGISGNLELLGAASVGAGNTSSVPVGGALLSHRNFTSATDIAWSTLEWEIISATQASVKIDGGSPTVLPINGWVTGNGDLSNIPNGNSRGVISSLMIRKPESDDVSKKWFVWVDDVTIDSAGVPNPLFVQGPLDEYDTAVTVTNIDATATQVQLKKNGGNLGSPVSPPYNNGATSHIFTVSGLQIGDQISATQTVGGNPFNSNTVVVISGGMIEEFSGGVTAADNGTSPRTWYDATFNTFGAALATTLDSSPAMRVSDSGFTNGVYALYDDVIPADGTYHIRADIKVVEDAAQPNSIQAAQLGVTVNGAYRAGNTLPAMIDFGSFTGLTSGLDSLPTQKVATTSFTAVAGDDLLIAVGTDVASGNWNLKSTTWGTGTIHVDNIELVQGVACVEIPAVTLTGPLGETGPSSTSAVVTGVDTANATDVHVYAYVSGTPTLAGTIAGPFASATVTVPLTLPLTKGQTAVATQEFATGEGCIPLSGVIVGSGTNAKLKFTLGVRESNSPGPIGADGGTSGGIEFVGASTTLSGAPQGTEVITPGPNWQTVTFDPTNAANIVAFTGAGADGILTSTTGFAVLEHLAVTADASDLDTGPFTLYIDEVKNGSTVVQSFDSATLGTQVLFRQPTYSGSTNAKLLSGPNQSVVVDEQNDTAPHSARLTWQFKTESDTNWIRLTTFGLGNPTIDISQPITMRVLLLEGTPSLCNDPFADADGDDDVDQTDFGLWQLCAAYTTPPAITPECACFDRNDDDAVDSTDFLDFEACVTGPAPAAGVFDPACDD